MKEAEVVRIRTSILRRHNTVVLCEVTERRPGTRFPRRWWDQTGIGCKAVREKAAAKEEDDVAEAAEPELMGSDSYPEADTPGGNTGGTGEEASLGASGSSGAGRRINLSGRYLKA